MRSRRFRAGAFVCLATAFALGQDPTKVEPKHYKQSFEHDQVQVVTKHKLTELNGHAVDFIARIRPRREELSDCAAQRAWRRMPTRQLLKPKTSFF